MSMSKKDFIALADRIREHEQGALEQDKFSAVHLRVLADFCTGQNSRFMRDRWLGYIDGTNGKNGGAVKATRKGKSGVEYLAQHPGWKTS